MAGESLLDVRLAFRRATGRFDLVDHDGSDRGANYYLNAGQRLLDGLVDYPATECKHLVALSANQSFVAIPALRVVKEVRISDLESSRALMKLTLREFKQFYSSRQVIGGSPVHYAVAISGVSPTLLGEVEGTEEEPGYFFGLTDKKDLVYGTEGFGVKGILVGPPADKAYTLSVTGLFFSKTLENDDDKTFWTTQRPDLLVLAGKYCLEREHNSEAAILTYKAILNELRMLVFDAADEESAEFHVMEG